MRSATAAVCIQVRWAGRWWWSYSYCCAEMSLRSSSAARPCSCCCRVCVLLLRCVPAALPAHPLPHLRPAAFAAPPSCAPACIHAGIQPRRLIPLLSPPCRHAAPALPAGHGAGSRVLWVMFLAYAECVGGGLERRLREQRVEPSHPPHRCACADPPIGLPALTPPMRSTPPIIYPLPHPHLSLQRPAVQPAAALHFTAGS